MALETLKNISTVGEFSICEGDLGVWGDGSEDEGWSPITVDSCENSIAFKIQSGPIKENGLNGCQVDEIIETARLIVKGLNENYPCPENAMVMMHLQMALQALKIRKENRKTRGVEGYNKA